MEDAVRTGKFSYLISHGEINEIEFNIAFGSNLREKFIKTNCDSSLALNVQREYEFSDYKASYELENCRNYSYSDLEPKGKYIYIYMANIEKWTRNFI